MPSKAGLILDASALVSFMHLQEWSWLKYHYRPLYITQELLQSEHLTPETRQAASRYLQPFVINSEDILASSIQLRTQYPLLSQAERATLAIALDRQLYCATDDALTSQVCQTLNIPWIHTLHLIEEMVQTGNKTPEKATNLVNTLVIQRQKWMSFQDLANRK